MELRDRIIKAGLETFSEYGYEKATIAMIVKKANSSKGGFYHHFKSKSDVLDEITKQFMDELKDGYYKILENTNEDTIYLLNNVFTTVNAYKKEKLGKWKELVNLYSHKDSHSIIQKMANDFVDLTADIYEKLILKGISEKIFNPSNPKALACLWSHETLRLYSKINQIILSHGSDELYNEFIAQADFVEETINHALNPDENIILIKEPALSYLNMVLEKMKEMQ